jgi:hypothetical protein
MKEAPSEGSVVTHGERPILYGEREASQNIGIQQAHATETRRDLKPKYFRTI